MFLIKMLMWICLSGSFIRSDDKQHPLKNYEFIQTSHILFSSVYVPLLENALNKFWSELVEGGKNLYAIEERIHTFYGCA